MSKFRQQGLSLDQTNKVCKVSSQSGNECDCTLHTKIHGRKDEQQDHQKELGDHLVSFQHSLLWGMPINDFRDELNIFFS